MKRKAKRQTQANGRTEQNRKEEKGEKDQRKTEMNKDRREKYS